MRDCPVGTRYAGKYCVPDGTRGDAYANDFSTNILSLSGYNLNEHFLDHCRIFYTPPVGHSRTAKSSMKMKIKKWGSLFKKLRSCFVA